MRNSRILGPVVGILLSVLVWGVVAAEEPQPLTKAGIVGVWRVCYEPGMDGVSEPDAGYLVMLPGDRYTILQEVVAPEGGSPLVIESGTYDVQASTVVLHPSKRQGVSGGKAGGTHLNPRAMMYDASRSVVFWPEGVDSPITAPVLAPGPSANYGFAKVL